MKLEDSFLLSVPCRIWESLVSLHHLVAVSLYCKRISLRSNYASNQSPTSYAPAISYFFLYFVNVVLNSNEKVHRGFVFAIQRVKFWSSWKEQSLISTVSRFHVWNFKDIHKLKKRDQRVNMIYSIYSSNNSAYFPNSEGTHCNTEGTSKQHTSYNASKEATNLLSATQNSAILTLQLAFGFWILVKMQLFDKQLYWLKVKTREETS